MSAPEQRLAAHVAGLAWEAVPDQAARNLLVVAEDLVACLLAGLRSPTCRRLAERAHATGGAAQASIAGMDVRVPAASASFVNAALAHWHEWDDVHDSAALHATAVILPVLLAATEAAGLDRDGRAFAAAAVAAIDVAGRVGEPIVPWTSSAWMPTGIACSVAAAAGAARLLGLGQAGIASAMGLAAAGGGLLRQPLVDKVDGKNVLCAQAASRALEAALLAADGVVGAPHFLTGQFGLGQVFAGGRADLMAGLDDLGRRFTVDELSLKPYPSCRSAHPATDLALDLAAEHALEPAAIERVEARVPRPMFELCGAPFAPGAAPRVSAQFSIAYNVAVALSRGAPRLGDFDAARIVADDAVRGLAGRIITTPYDLPPGQRVLGQPVTLAIHLRDGQALERTSCIVKGSPARPMSDADRATKLGDAAHGALKDADLARLRAAVSGLPTGGIAPVMTILRAAAWPGASLP